MRLNPLRLLCLAAVAWAGNAFAVSSEFTYQGTLEDGGQPANGVYDLVFNLKSETGASLFSPILFDDVPVVGGVFTVTLDFGPAAFPGANRSLRIGVRPGDSAGQYTTLAPDVLLTAAPYAQYANESDSRTAPIFASSAITASLADDVIDNAIDEVDIDTGAVSARNIATDAVGASELANNSVGRANLVGADYVSPANLNATIAANDCSDFDVPVGGGFEPGDSVVLNLNSALASNLTIVPMQVVSTNVVKLRICNAGTTSQSLTNESIRMFSIR